MKSLIPASYLGWFVLAILLLSVLLVLLNNSKIGPVLYSEFKWLGIFRSMFSENKTGPQVTFSNNGRGGYVYYTSNEGNFDMYWEFGGNDVLASLEIPGAQEWVSKTGIPLEKRDAVLDFIGKQVVAQQTTNGSGFYKIEGNWLNIYTGPR